MRSIGWDFSANIEQAQREGYEDIEHLKTLAARITQAWNRFDYYFKKLLC